MDLYFRRLIFNTQAWFCKQGHKRQHHAWEVEAFLPMCGPAAFWLVTSVLSSSSISSSHKLIYIYFQATGDRHRRRYEREVGLAKKLPMEVVASGHCVDRPSKPLGRACTYVGLEARRCGEKLEGRGGPPIDSPVTGKRSASATTMRRLGQYSRA
ncbi:hypothetical protein B0H12DRAFT_299507 [Mycena haematopus]|nr:hypothetical protein B0H12DRAFT_299507 [Mycena haematopus]